MSETRMPTPAPAQAPVPAPASVPGQGPAPDQAPAPLDLCGIAVAYGSRTVLSDVTLAVGAGELVGLVGPNGCGKSTLLRVAEGLLTPSAGRALLGGVPVGELSPRERARRVALLPQVHRTPSMSVRDLVACGRYPHMGTFGRLGAADHAAVDEALALMGLEALADRPARSLSGGERQRAFVAMTLAQGAGLLMLDEPTTYLDVRAALELMDLVRGLVDQGGRSVLVVLHDLDLALRTCDRLVVLAPEAAPGASTASAAAPGTSAASSSGASAPAAAPPPSRVLVDAAPAEVLASGALERAFGVVACAHATPHGPAYSFFAPPPP